MGSDTVDAGGPGKGIRVKMINNYMSIALNALSAEAMTLSEAIGLDFHTEMEVMGGTPAGKGHFNTTWPNKVLAGDLSPAFMVDLAHKDLGIALDLANAVNVPMPMGQLPANFVVSLVQQAVGVRTGPRFLNSCD